MSLREWLIVLFVTGATKQRRVPGGRLRKGGGTLLRCSPVGPDQPHPVQQPVRSAGQDGAVHAGPAGRHPGTRTQPQVAQGTLPGITLALTLY